MIPKTSYSPLETTIRIYSLITDIWTTYESSNFQFLTFIVRNLKRKLVIFYSWSLFFKRSRRREQHEDISEPSVYHLLILIYFSFELCTCTFVWGYYNYIFFPHGCTTSIAIFLMVIINTFQLGYNELE